MKKEQVIKLKSINLMKMASLNKLFIIMIIKLKVIINTISIHLLNNNLIIIKQFHLEQNLQFLQKLLKEIKV